MMTGYDIYDRFTMEHFPLRQSIILTTSFFFSRQYISEKTLSYFFLSATVYYHYGFFFSLFTRGVPTSDFFFCRNPLYVLQQFLDLKF
jgi:hypothetical protein